MESIPDKPGPGQAPAEREAWAARAADLASWADRWLVSRRDVWGGYWAHPDTGAVAPTTRPSKDRRGQLLLTPDRLARHFAGEDLRERVGLHSASPGPDSAARWLAVDIDLHDGGDADPADNLAAAIHWYDVLAGLDLRPLLTASNGRGGYHLLAVFAAPIPLAVAWAAARWLVRDHADLRLPKPPETFPKQPRLSPPGQPGEYGNWLRLPGPHHRRPHWSQAWGGDRWLSGSVAVAHILSIEGGDPGRLLAAGAGFASPAPTPQRFDASAMAGQKYAVAALRREAHAVATAPPTTRNTRLNRAAFSTGQLVGAGLLDADGVEQVLTAAAVASGLDGREIPATIRSGLRAGQAKPRGVPR